MEFSRSDTKDDITAIPDMGTPLQDLSASSTAIRSTPSSANTMNAPELQPVQSLGWKRLGYHRNETLGAPPDSEDIPQDFIESKYPRGYPRLAAFMNIEPKFDMFRRFGRLHIRMLLYKQDELTELEEKLELEDSQERIQLHLSSRRHDQNETRALLLQQIDRKLAEYGIKDKMLLRHHNFQSLKSVTPRNSRSFLNWINGTRPLVRSETSFINDIEDFVPSSQHLHEHGFLDSGIEWLLPKLCSSCTRIFAPKALRRKSSYEHLHLYSERRIRRLVKLLVTIVTVKALLVPVVLLYYLENSQTRLCIVLSFTFGVSLMLAGFTNASRYEIFAATAAYCAVLVVFLAALS